MYRTNFLTLLWIIVIGWGCAPALITHSNLETPKLRLLDVNIIPHNFTYENTLVGGLSGIDYNSKTNQYYIISDERSATSPARFYTADIDIQNNKIASVNFTSVHTLKQAGGHTFPSIKENAVRAADPESIRYNPVKNTLVWSSEGDKAVRNGAAVLQDPFVYEIDVKGNFLDSFLIPSHLRMKAGEAGPRTNGAFEGLTFDKNFNALYVSIEEPLFDDGPRADVDIPGAPVRITKFNTATRKPIAQYAYLLDAVARKPLLADAFRVNGVPEILWYDENKLLVMERSFTMGILSSTIKIYLTDYSNATDVLNRANLIKKAAYQPMSKRLLLNSDSLSQFTDNIEGMTFGPKLPNGNRSLILIADNNFQKIQKSQVFLLEVVE